MTGGFFMARQEGRIGVASEHAGLAFYLTEQGLVDLMSHWSPAVFGALPYWGPRRNVSAASDASFPSPSNPGMPPNVYQYFDIHRTKNLLTVLGFWW